MDEDERDEILYRLDTRTKRVDNHLNRLDERVENVENDVDKLENIARSNKQDINAGKGIIGALAAALTAAVGKVFGVLGL